MAEIRFTAFVEGNLGSWALKTSEPHSKKDESGKWVTVSRTFRTVKAAYGYDVDFSQFREGDRIEVIGKELTEIREDNGQKYYNLVVKAEDVALASQAPRGGQQKAPEYASIGKSIDDDAPF